MKFFTDTLGNYYPVRNIELISSVFNDGYDVYLKNEGHVRISYDTLDDLVNEPGPTITLPPGWRFRVENDGEVYPAIAISYSGDGSLEYVYISDCRCPAHEGKLLAPGVEA